MTEHTRLVLITPMPAGPESWPGDMAVALQAALEAGRIDAVIIRLPEADERTQIKLAKPVIALVQEHGAAALLQDAPALVARSGADGVHLSEPAPLRDALGALKPHDRIVGAGGLRARHDAMEAAEEDCDYVLFGEMAADGTAPPFSAVLERAEWWAELFQTPCVARVASLDEVGPMAATGCEFVALDDAVFAHPGGPAEAVRVALAAVAAAPAPLR